MLVIITSKVRTVKQKVKPLSPPTLLCFLMRLVDRLSTYLRIDLYVYDLQHSTKLDWKGRPTKVKLQEQVELI